MALWGSFVHTWWAEDFSFGDHAMHNQNPRPVSPEPPDCIGEAAHDVVRHCFRRVWVGHILVGADDKCVALNEASRRWRKYASMGVTKAHLASIHWPRAA